MVQMIGNHHTNNHINPPKRHNCVQQTIIKALAHIETLAYPIFGQGNDLRKQTGQGPETTVANTGDPNPRPMSVECPQGGQTETRTLNAQSKPWAFRTRHRYSGIPSRGPCRKPHQGKQNGSRFRPSCWQRALRLPCAKSWAAVEGPKLTRSHKAFVL